MPWPAWHQRVSLLLILIRDAAGAARQCLPNPVEERFRKNVTVDGISRPIGIWVNGWDSAEVVSELYGILVSELMGYNVELSEGSNGRTQVQRLAGCYGAPEDGCGPPRKYHIGLESWFAQTAYGQEYLKELRENAPTIVNTLPYIGNSGMFILDSPRRQALEAEGMALEYYRFYDADWYRPQKYTSQVYEIDLDRLKTCGVSILSLYPDIADIYLAATGDHDGVLDVNGTKELKCYLGKWFASPACRAQPQNCTALITGGDGWGTLHLTQQISFHNMPVAIATAVSRDDWRILNQEFPSLVYWWKPDTTFVLQSPAYVILPLHNQSEYARLNYRSQRKHTWLVNLAAPGFAEVAPLPVSLVRNMQITEADISKLLALHVQQDGTPDAWTSACTWLLQETKWTSWIPSVTDCFPGSGLVDAAGNWVADTTLAVGCQPCPTGAFSKGLAGTRTRACQLCPAGSNQHLVGQSACTPCAPGSVAPEPGLTECELCGLGKYANESGMTACHACGDQEQASLWTTRLQLGASRSVLKDGASSAAECSCADGAFLTHGRCAVCTSGAICKGGGNLTLHPGYFSAVEEPNFIYRCFGSLAAACPGGQPGICAEGRDPSSVACSHCLPGFRSKDSTCTACGAGDAVFAVFVSLSFVCLVVFMYLIWVRRSHRTGYSGHVLITALALGQMVTAFQQLLVIQQFEIVWAEPFRGLMEAVDFISLNLQIVSVECFAPQGELMRYVLQTLLVPAVAVVLGIVHVIYILSIRSSSAHPELLVGAFGSILLTFFITLCSNILAPFRCHLHPNGMQTVQDYPGAFCSGEGAHSWMVIVGLATCTMPVGFFSVCCVVMMQLPKRLMLADVKFIRNTSFLLIRYRPGAERFAILHLARNALMVLCPLLSSPSGRILSMNGLVLLSLIATAAVRPWRMPECNYLELLVLAGMLVILDAGSLYMKEVDNEVVTAICMTCMWIMSLSGLVGSLAYGVGKHLQLKYHKRFQFFLCHHKKSSGAFARLLKMNLAQKDMEGGDVFIDCDDLTDLTRLFGYVAHETSTFVILGSPHVLTRKWCIGEMATARMHGVESVLLAYPGFVKPSEQMIASYFDLVLDISELSNYNIGFDDVRETLRWINSVMSLELDPVLNTDTVAHVVRRLRGTDASRLSSIGSDRNYGNEDCHIVSDISNLESTAAAFVLFGYVSRKLLMDDSHFTLSVLLPGKHVSRTAKCALLLCTVDCFRSLQFAEWLIEVQELSNCTELPIVADDFMPPPPAFWEQITVDPSWSRTIRVPTYMRILKAVFKEIPVTFSAQNYSADAFCTDSCVWRERLQKFVSDGPAGADLLTHR
ncbi:RPS6 [Symbiodinium natans]|uniref:RPS6 protein n=1 Tax=Symbiodinium natans TaxID=878477 RepID=A0A812P159_9DINO|nr:RPS6 [Symbiodinium natans]